MKLSMARVSVSSCSPHTSSNMDLRGTGLPSRWIRKRSRFASIRVSGNTWSRTCSSSRSKCTDLSPKVNVSPSSSRGAGVAGIAASSHPPSLGGLGGRRRRIPRPQPLAAAQQSADTRDQDGQFEGLRQVIVGARFETRSEEHTSELQSLRHLVCRLLLENK